MENALLDLLCSPESHAPLRFARDDELARINALIRAGQLRTRSGTLVKQEFESCLVCEREGACFPIRDQLPVLLSVESFSAPNPL
jgi:uncharacterized protein YbaR (Trm112 family)